MWVFSGTASVHCGYLVSTWYIKFLFPLPGIFSWQPMGFIHPAAAKVCGLPLCRPQSAPCPWSFRDRVVWHRGMSWHGMLQLVRLGEPTAQGEAGVPAHSAVVEAAPHLVQLTRLTDPLPCRLDSPALWSYSHGFCWYDSEDNGNCEFSFGSNWHVLLFD